MKVRLRITSGSLVVMRGCIRLRHRITCSVCSRSSPAIRAITIGIPTETANVNLGPPIWDQEPNITSDGLSMYFTSRQRPGPEYPAGDFYQYVASRDNVNDDWGTPEPLPLAQNQGGDGSASITSDSLGLYYSSGGDFLHPPALTSTW